MTPASARLPVGFYGDDFTGAVDALLQFTRAGWHGRLLLGLPSPGELAAVAADQDVIGLAGVARSLAPADLDREVRPALTALAALRPVVVQYKACSTADSSPTLGSLGRVIEIGREVFDQRCIPLLFAQPDFGRYTCFGHHFAADGGKVYRLDRQPTMWRHPTTPMHESDLAVHLSRQTPLPIGSLPFTAYGDPAAITRAVRSSPEGAVVLDALSDEHVELVARGIIDVAEAPVMAIGAGGLSKGLGRALTPRAARDAGSGLVPAEPQGPVLVLSGSCSPQTKRQIRFVHDRGWQVLAVPVGDAGSADAVAAEAIHALRRGASTVVSTCDPGDDGATPGRGTGTELLPDLANRLAELLRRAVENDLVRRVVVCGGDTSSRVMRAVGAQSLQIVANPVGNVALCRLSAPGSPLDAIEVVLKGGQVGPIELFDLVETWGAPR